MRTDLEYPVEIKSFACSNEIETHAVSDDYNYIGFDTISDLIEFDRIPASVLYLTLANIADPQLIKYLVGIGDETDSSSIDAGIIPASSTT